MKNSTEERIQVLNTKKGIKALLLAAEPVDPEAIADQLLAEKKLEKLQAKMVGIQSEFIDKKKRAIVVLEGMDTTGKASCIKAVTSYLNARYINVIAYPKPKANETKRWYFQKFVEKIPHEEQMVFFNRSWYNRATIEPIYNLCSSEEFKRFLKETVQFEHSLISDGIEVIKILLRIDKKEQKRRILELQNNPLKSWKLNYFKSEVNRDYETFIRYENEMIESTSTKLSPWKIIHENNYTMAQIEVIKNVIARLS